MKSKEIKPAHITALESRYSYKEIAKKLGISKIYLYVLRKKWGMIKTKEVKDVGINKNRRKERRRISIQLRNKIESTTKTVIRPDGC